jgi:arabinose-5-phosphate isomerase
MHTGEEIPRVRRDAPMPEVIFEMSRKGLGHTAVVDGDGRVVGIISDGDLRRFLQRAGNRALDFTASDCMTLKPVSISRKELATQALNLMEARKITSLLVVDPDGRLEGVVHLHDLWTTQML